MNEGRRSIANMAKKTKAEAGERPRRARQTHRKAKQENSVRRMPRSTVEPRACCCYIVQCADGSFYTGWAIDAEKRLKVHNAGRGARYTRARRPVQLVYVEVQPDRITAMRRERAIKHLTRAQKQKLIGRM